MSKYHRQTSRQILHDTDEDRDRDDRDDRPRCFLAHHEGDGPPATHGLICEGDYRRAYAELAAIPDDMAVARTELLPGKGGDGRATERTLGLRVDALDVILGHDPLRDLHQWERLVREEKGLTPPALLEREESVWKEYVATCMFLRGHLPWICQQPWVDEFLDGQWEIRTVRYPDGAIREMRTRVCHGVHSAFRMVEQAARRTQTRPTRIECPAQGCGKRLTLPEDDTGQEIPCRHCGKLWTRHLLVLLAMNNKTKVYFQTVGQLASQLGLSERRVRQIANQSRDGKGARRNPDRPSEYETHDVVDEWQRIQAGKANAGIGMPPVAGVA